MSIYVPTKSLRCTRRRDRRGAIVVLAALFTGILCVCVAFAVDIGYIVNARTELQRSADSAAMAAAWELIDDAALAGDTSMTAAISSSRDFAETFAAYNPVCLGSPSIDKNSSNAVDGDVVVGYISDPSDPSSPMTYGNTSEFNAVKVTVRRSATQNGSVQLYFARVLGLNTQEVEAEATAAIEKYINGFQTPSDGSNLPLLPIAFDLETWNDMMAGTGDDNWKWNEETGAVESGSDGIPESSMYPENTGAPGNRGTVKMGRTNNSTKSLGEQIQDGVTEAQMDNMGGSLEFDSNGEIEMPADPGLSNGIKDDLAAIVGEPRIIPIYSAVNGNGNNAKYTVVKFVGIRILDVHMTGGNKYVKFQPANVVTKGGIPSTTSGTSDFVYSGVRLIR